MIQPPDKFQTDRLTLRIPVIEDAGAIYEEYAADPEVTRYLIWPPHTSQETVAEFLKWAIECHESGQEYSWGLTFKGQNHVTGMIGTRISGHMVEIGYVLGRKHWNRGYMTEAITAITEWFLEQPGIFRVWAACDIENIASVRALEKSQFEREGILRRWIIHPNISPEPRDCYLYARVR